MDALEHYGRVMTRGSEQYLVETESDFFTVVSRAGRDAKKIESLIAPKSIQHIGRRLLKVQVDRDHCDAAMEKLRSKEGGLVCHHAYRLPGRVGTRYFLTDVLIARVINGLFNPEALFHSHGLEVLKHCEGVANTYALRVTDRAGKNPLKVAHDLNRLSEIVYAEPNLMERFAFDTPSVPIDWNKLWHLDRISARQAWVHSKGVREVVIAVVDDDCDLSHPAFGGIDKIVHPIDFVDGDAKPWSNHEAVESGRHGTPCAGLAIAEPYENGVIGVAPGCGFMPVRMTALERMEVETLNVRDMFEYTGRHADIISCSWSSVPCYSPMPQSIADVFDTIINEGGPRGRGTVICFAAGNHNAPIRDDDNRHFEYKVRPGDESIQVAQTKLLNGFAAHPDVISVAATNSNDQKARYSNWGKETNVSAPSDDYDPFTGQPLSHDELFTTDNEGHGPGIVPGDIVTGFGGTSGACPVVAGVAGLVRSVRPYLRARQVKAIIEETADGVTDVNANTAEERARASFIAGHSAWYGYGRVNAQKAVEKAMLFQ